MRAKQENKQANKQTSKQSMKENNHVSKQLKANTTPAPTLMVHGLDHMKWYLQCGHRRIGRPMWVKVWFVSNLVVWTSIQEIYNTEDNHTLFFKVPTGHKRVHVHDRQSMDLSWCCVTLSATLKHKHTLDYDMQANETNKDNLCHAQALAM